MLEAKLNAGQIDPEDYLKGLEATVERDTKLLEFYTAKGITFYINFINAKLRIYKKEISDMKGQAEEPQEEQPQQTSVQESQKVEPEQKQQQSDQQEEQKHEEPKLEEQKQEAASTSGLVITKAATNSLNGIDPSELPAGLTLEDVMEPDNPVKNQSYTFLEELHKQLEAAKTQMMGGFGSVAESKYVRDKWSSAFKEFNVTIYLI